MFSHLTYFKEHLSDIYHLARHETLDGLLAQPIEQCPHIMFYGPDGGLKKEYARIVIAGLYGARSEDIHTTSYIHTLTINNNKHEVPVVSTAYSMEFWPSEISVYDRNIVSDIIKPIISQKSPVRARHIIVFHDAHLLSQQAMMSLRRMMEIYYNNALFVMIATTINGIPKPILSRCCLVRCPLLSKEQISAICNNVCDAMTSKKTPLEVSTLSSHDIYINLLNLDNNGNNNSDILHNELKIFMDGLRKCRTPWTIYDRIKEYVHKVLYYKYSTRELFGTLISYIITKYGNKGATMIAVVAEADHQLTQGTCPNFIYEKMFLGCVAAASNI
jgi:hypothetical protein